MREEWVAVADSLAPPGGRESRQRRIAMIGPRPGPGALESRPRNADNDDMFIAYALDMANPENDQEIECADLDEALAHLRELIQADMDEAYYYEEPMSFDRYGVRVMVDFARLPL